MADASPRNKHRESCTPNSWGTSDPAQTCRLPLPVFSCLARTELSAVMYRYGVKREVWQIGGACPGACDATFGRDKHEVSPAHFQTVLPPTGPAVVDRIAHLFHSRH